MASAMNCAPARFTRTRRRPRARSERTPATRCKSISSRSAAAALTLTDLAAVAGADPSTVCRWFRRFQGISPYQYLLRRKMNLAAQFLIENRGMVKEAAAFVGFADPYHFSRVFKSVHGVPP